MKKNISLSLGSYLLALVVLFAGVQIVNIIDVGSPVTARQANILVSILFFALMIIGIVFAFRGNKNKESSLSTKISIIIGILVSLYFGLMYLGLGGF